MSLVERVLIIVQRILLDKRDDPSVKLGTLVWRGASTVRGYEINLCPLRLNAPFLTKLKLISTQGI